MRSQSASASSRWFVLIQDRLPASLQPPDVAPQRVAGFDVDAERRLIEDQQLRIVDERPSEGQPALEPPKATRPDLRPAL